MKSGIELKANETIVFIGDSITDTGRGVPAYQPFGFGYVHFVANTLLAKYPQYNLNIVNTGTSGNTVRNLKPRWKSDCLDHKPGILSVLIGVNDLWRRHVEPERHCEGVCPDEYEATYRELLFQAKERCRPQFVLMEPFMFCSDEGNRMFMGLGEYIEIVGRLAGEFDAVLVRLQSRVNEALKKVPAERWSEDMVHPYVWAHAWISQRWLEVAEL